MHVAMIPWPQTYETKINVKALGPSCPYGIESISVVSLIVQLRETSHEKFLNLPSNVLYRGIKIFVHSTELDSVL